MKPVCILLGIMFLIMFTACSSDKNIREPEIVVEGWIEDGLPPIVLLHEAIESYEDMSDINNLIKRKTINWGKVTFSGEDGSCVLTGKRDMSMIPPYKYTTSKILPETGGRYSIKVEYSGRELTASTTLLPPVAIDSVKVIPLSDTKAFVEVFWTDDPESKDWYCLFFRPEGGSQWICARMSAISDTGAENGGKMSEVLLPRNNLFYEDIYERDSGIVVFKRDLVLEIKLAHIDYEAYLFWKSFSDVSADGLFLSTSSSYLQSNIHGGSGYFTGLGSTYSKIKLQ